MDLSKEELQHIANLSNLTIREDQLDEYIKNMSSIINFANELNQLDTEDVDITTSILGEYNVFREDELKESFDRDLLLSNAPSSQDGMFKIPKVIGG